MNNNLEKDKKEIDKNVQLLHKVLGGQRDPGKRRVKPVPSGLVQFDLGSYGDSSDDSDFRLNSDLEDDDDDDSGASSRSSGSSSSDSDEDGSNDDDADESRRVDGCHGNGNGGHAVVKRKPAATKRKCDSDEDKENASVKKKKKKHNKYVECDDGGGVDDNDGLIEDVDVGEDSSLKRLRVPICSVCLGDANSSTNEIVECDGCFASVHEGCFGVSDTQSIASSDSSSSMEPWFCDACKAGVKPHCELCPNLGGIFKETDAGRWVHLACALYTPGVAFGDVEKLNNVTLFEMPYSRWGSKECSLCEDPRFSRVGVCISCDAGMCRVHFHVTCAQREGLLAEASQDEEIADPFYAYCKIHADKQQVRQNHRNWLALQSNIKNADADRALPEAEKVRFQRKLNSHQMKYQQAKSARPPCWVPKEKLPRMLLSNSYALKQLFRKAELQGVTEDISAKDTRKKKYVAPAFSVDFVSYYHDRNELVESMKVKAKEMQVLSVELRKQEKLLAANSEQLKQEMESLKTSSMHVQKVGLTLWDFMMNIAGKRIRIPESVSFRNFARSPVKKDSVDSTSSKHKLQCATCNQTHDQHLLARCDRCHKNHHLACLDPPLTRMPKKTKSQGWQCSFCSKDPDDNEEEDCAAEAEGQSRRLREKSLIKEPLKYTAQFADQNKIRSQKDRRVKRKTAASSISNGTSKSPANHVTGGSTNRDEKLKQQPDVHRNIVSPLSISSEEDDDDDDDDDDDAEDDKEINSAATDNHASRTDCSAKAASLNNDKALGEGKRLAKSSSNESQQETLVGGSSSSVIGEANRINLQQANQAQEKILSSTSEVPVISTSSTPEKSETKHNRRSIQDAKNTKKPSPPDVSLSSLLADGSPNVALLQKALKAAASKDTQAQVPTTSPSSVSLQNNLEGDGSASKPALKKVILRRNLPNSTRSVVPLVGGAASGIDGQAPINSSRTMVLLKTSPTGVASSANEKKVPIIIRRKQVPVPVDSSIATNNAPNSIITAKSPESSEAGLQIPATVLEMENKGDGSSGKEVLIEISDDDN